MAKIDWRDLQVGDYVHLSEVPAEFFQQGYYIDPDTLLVYQNLVESQIVLEIVEIDKDGIPWVEFTTAPHDVIHDMEEHHRLALNHSGITLTKR